MLKILKIKLSQVFNADVHPSLTQFQEISHWRLIYSTHENQIGKGGFSHVYLGKWGKQEVAIKRFRSEDQTEGVDEIAANEVHMARVVGHHPNIVYSYGSVRANRRTLLVMEYLPNGDLHEYLKKNPLTPEQHPIRNKMALQLAQGLVYLFSLRIIHCDIKSRNILLDENDNAKIADFSFAIQLSLGKNTHEHYTASGTLGWVPPEIFPGGLGNPGIYTETNDIWSYAILLWMLASDHVLTPFPGLGKRTIQKYAREGRGQTMTPTISDECKALLTRCWNINPKERPKPQEIVDLLENGLKLSK